MPDTSPDGTGAIVGFRCRPWNVAPLRVAAGPGASYLRAMADVPPRTGELQTQVMAAVWRLERATVEQVRSALPPRYRGA